MTRIKISLNIIAAIIAAALQLYISLGLFIIWLSVLLTILQTYTTFLAKVFILLFLVGLIGGKKNLRTIYNACVMSYLIIAVLKLIAVCYNASITQHLTQPVLVGILIVNLYFPLPLNHMVSTVVPTCTIKTRYGQYIALGTVLANVFLAYPLAASNILHAESLVIQIATIAMVGISLWFAGPMVLTVGYKTFWNINTKFGPLYFPYIAAVRSIKRRQVALSGLNLIIRLILVLFALCPSVAYADTGDGAGPVTESLLGRISTAITKQTTWFGSLCYKCGCSFVCGVESEAPEAFRVAGQRVGRAAPTVIAAGAADLYTDNALSNNLVSTGRSLIHWGSGLSFTFNEQTVTSNVAETAAIDTQSTSTSAPAVQTMSAPAVQTMPSTSEQGTVATTNTHVHKKIT